MDNLLTKLSDQWRSKMDNLLSRQITLLQFSCTKTGNFSDTFMSFNELCTLYIKIGQFPDDFRF